MATLKFGRDAAGAGQAHLQRIGFDRIGGGGVILIGEPCTDRLAEVAVAFLPARSAK
jgi:hypothetical protein